MLPAELLAVAPAFNMHGSLLPEYRGRAPVNWAVLHGATETGATLHEMTVKPDAGAIVSQMVVPILPDDTAHEVFGKVQVAAEQALWRVLPSLLDGTAPRLHNDLSKGGYFSGRKPEDGRIDWPAGPAGLQPAPRRGAALSGRLHRCQRGALCDPARPPEWQFGNVALSLPPGLTVVDNCIFGVCGDGRMLTISALTADGEPITAEQLQTRLAPA
jgi:methionyl-tRNA formyltransferase